jgi:CRP/FNR family cyclic AMP-dependent transcriptional regulator
VLQETLSGLQKIPYFADIPEDVLGQLAASAVRKSFPKNTVIIHEGDDAGPLFIVLSGRVRAYLGNEAGKEVTLSLQGPSSCFGELSLLDDQPRSASVMTMEPTICALISKPSFIAWLNGHPATAGLGLMRGLTRRIRQLTENVRGLALTDVYGRLVKLLLDMAVEENGEWVIHSRLSQQELANLVGCSREMISKLMKDLANGGYLSTEGKDLRIHRPFPPAW